MNTNETNKIPAGTYKGKALPESLQYGTTNNGHDQIVIDLELYGIEGDFVGRVSCPMVFTEKSTPFQQDRLRALGWDGSQNPDLPGIGSAEADVSIAYEMYEGKEQLRVNVLTGGGGIKIPEERKMNAEQRRRFAATFLAAAGGQRPPSTQQQRPPAAAAGGQRPRF